MVSQQGIMVEHADDLSNITTAEWPPSAATPCGLPAPHGEHPLATAPDAPSAPDPLPCTPPGKLDGCPTPLAWQEVLRTFRGESTPWELGRGTYSLRGREWGEGPPLYFLNGLGGTYELSALLVWLLRDHFRCVLFDYPGTHGECVRLSRITLSDLVEDLFAVADARGDRKFFLHASSFGGLIALQALASQPGRIERAILQGAFAHRQLSWAERGLIQACRWLPLRMGQMPFHAALQRQNHRPWFPPHDPTRWQFLAEDTGGLPLSAVAHRAGIVRDADLRPLLPTISQPILLVSGEGEGLVGSGCREVLRSGLPHATYEWMHSAGFLPSLTHPHRLAKLIRPFLLESAGQA
jgi:pimeloyl-ACP methyl ester carboxylesterase